MHNFIDECIFHVLLSGQPSMRHINLQLKLLLKLSFFQVLCLLVSSVASQNSRFNPSIIQDSRLEPKVDGTYPFIH